MPAGCLINWGCRACMLGPCCVKSFSFVVKIEGHGMKRCSRWYSRTFASGIIWLFHPQFFGSTILVRVPRLFCWLMLFWFQALERISWNDKACCPIISINAGSCSLETLWNKLLAFSKLFLFDCLNMKDRFHCELLAKSVCSMGEVKFSFSSLFMPADFENAKQWLFVFFSASPRPAMTMEEVITKVHQALPSLIYSSRSCFYKFVLIWTIYLSVGHFTWCLLAWLMLAGRPLRGMARRISFT